MSVINTNITSLIGQQNLNKSQNALSTAMERLSSGLRINSAKDDAAGQAVANRMSSQIKGLAQAQRNANDGISMAQTAEGALNQINDNLQRVRELTVQAQNGTNSADDLTSIQGEINQRLGEIDRISKETNFNGTKVLSDTTGLNIQVGANDGESITVNLNKIDSDTLSLSGFSVEKASLKTSAAITQLTDGQGVTISVDLSAAATTLTTQLGETVKAEDLTYRNILDSSTGASTAEFVIEYKGQNYAAMDATGGGSVDVVTGADLGGTVSTDENFAVKVSYDKDGVVTGYTENKDGNLVTVTTPFNTATAIATAATFEGAATANPLDKLDDALKTVDTLRSDLGAIQNRFESAITNLQTNQTNLTAARSRIEDADYAVEVANMTRAQILQQAGTSVLAQANQVPQGVLSLLG
ncbi:FliC/FljB family flagellin [Oceanisphaera arctica]|uniref:Flagellin n=1 Tax=Oceanisphaera arctica TaxID=641510 RepID=A0A2P5TMT9_9GAMM|nr:FliC/FljB family flagellin [Oceanisphaera arctica]PPL16743.1 flagellin [Oceanisphaera arctica]GHA06153.1 flagellin [Oceanisphaera arctica]